MEKGVVENDFYRFELKQQGGKRIIRKYRKSRSIVELILGSLMWVYLSLEFIGFSAIIITIIDRLDGQVDYYDIIDFILWMVIPIIILITVYFIRKERNPGNKGEDFYNLMRN